MKLEGYSREENARKLSINEIQVRVSGSERTATITGIRKYDTGTELIHEDSKP
jgi:hypothetical protein